MNEDEEEFALTGIQIDGKGVLLASGSWGEVYKVEHDGVQRAAKKLLTKPTDVSMFVKNCQRYNKLVHINVLPVLGLCKCDQSDIPAIVMELMECSLADKLQHHQNIPMHLKLSMLQGISEGLCYLHTHIPPIVHGNLHSKNIFLTSSLVAKIGDILPVSVPRKASSPFLPFFTWCDHPTPSLDIFAFGCVICHVITQQLPIPSGTTSNEVQLRQHYIKQIELEPLKQLVIISLDNKSENCPLASLLCEKITTIRRYWSSSQVTTNTGYLKVLFIGPGGAGKTTLTASLLGDSLRTKPKMTIGIEMYQKCLSVQQSMKETSFSLKVADFAGQMQYRSIYPLFIPMEAISIITFNAHVKVEVVIHPIIHCCKVVHSSYLETACYLKFSPLLPPVLLVGTHIDLIHPDMKIARKIAKHKFIPRFRVEIFDKPYAQHLVGMGKGIESALDTALFFISNKFQDEEMHRLKCTIAQVGTQLMKNNSTMYCQIQQALSSCKTQVISQSQMVSIITKNTVASVGEDSAELRKILLQLHNKRDILHFNQVESLKDVVVPNPHWLAKLFGYVLTTYPHNTLEPNYQRAWDRLKLTGILHESLLCHILAKYTTDFPDAPHITYQQLRDILLGFHLLAPINKTCFGNIDDTGSGDSFIVPSLASVSISQDIPMTEQRKAVVRYTFFDSVAPTFILHQLIAGCICHCVNKKQVIWWVTNGNVRLQLGTHLNYYVNLCEDKKGIQVTITTSLQNTSTEDASYEEISELISHVTDLLDNVMRVYMPAAKRPIPFFPFAFSSKLTSCTGIHSIEQSKPVPSITWPSGAPQLEIDHASAATVPVPDQRHQPTGSKQKLEIFLDYYGKLSTALPFKDMACHFVADRIITSDENQEIQHTIKKPEIACFVLNKIVDSLNIGEEEKFDKFLAIMEDYNEDVCVVRMSEKIKAKLFPETIKHESTQSPKSKRSRTT